MIGAAVFRSATKALLALAASSGASLVGFIQAGAGAVARTLQDKARERLSVKDFGAVGDGAADDTAAIQAAIAAVTSGSTIYFPKGSYKFTATLQINLQNITFEGAGQSTTLNYYGQGDAIALDTDDGGQWDAGSYDGRGQGFRLKKLTLQCLNSGAAGQLRTALLNSITGRYYGTGTCGIRDWRGGAVAVEDSTISGFEFGFWGVQSDLNCWRNVILSFNHCAVFLGARSDQGLYDHVWSFGNDKVWRIEGARQVRISHWITDTDGSGTTWPAEVRNAAPAVNAKYTATREVAGLVFEHPWCEQLGTFGAANPGYDVDAIFNLHVGDAAQAGGVVIDSPVLLGYDQAAAAPHFFYLVRCGNLTSVTVREVASARINVPWSGLKALFVIDATAPTTPRVFFSDADGLYTARLVENYTASTCFVQFRTDGFTNTYRANILGGTGAVLFGGLGLQRRLVHNNTPDPTFAAADITLNRTYTSGKSFGWIGDGGAAIALHAPTIGPNRGDADVTLTPETDHEEQSFSTALTADRTVILAAPPAAAKGYLYAVTRYGGGAFNLNVRNLNGGGTLLKALPASSWGVFMWDGANWLLRRYGGL